MGDFRIPYGMALGKYNNFFATTSNVFSESDVTPDVTLGSLFFSNNTSNTTITNFDVTGFGAGSQAGQFEGKVIEVVFLDGSTRLANASPLILAGSNGLQGANNSIRLAYHNSSWIELNRSYNASNVISVDSTTWNTINNIFINSSTS